MKYLINGLLLIIIVHLQIFCNAQLPIRFTTENESQYIGKNISIFEDTLGKYSLEEVWRHPEFFRSQNKDVPNLGTTHFNHWLRFSIVNASRFNKLILNLSNPSIDKVALYVLHGNGRIDSIQINGNLPVTTRIYEHQFFIFPIRVASGDSVTCFLSLKSNKQVTAPIMLHTETGIISAISISDILSGLYLGVMFAMMLYNLFIYFSIKDRHYLSYVHYLFWVTITQCTLLGYLHRFLLPANEWVLKHILIFTAAMAGMTAIFFTKSFLYVKKYARRFNWVLNLMILCDLIVIVMLFSHYSLLAYQLANFVAGLGALLVIIIAICVYHKKYSPAKYFLIAWSIFMASIIIFVLNDFGFIKYNFWATHAMQIGSAAEAILLSFALADKINVLKKEKELSHAEALNAAMENEKIIREQNILLEIKVAERTSELNMALEDIKQTQSQLVESEKMASLGQLTAGIAHEINNPINFVTSNVSPLRRDIDILFEAMNYIEELAVSNAPRDSKQMQLYEYKEAQEIDYLRMEIMHLINGISNGASRTAEIVKGLRIFSRLDEDNLKYASINEGINSAIIILNNQFGKIKIIRHYSELPQIECYPGKLNQVFLNILSNAVYAIHKRFGEQSGGEIIITTTIEQDDVKISIKDNGIGMDEATRKRVFDPFFTTKDVGEGTGLGMSIGYTTIKKHNGSICINSKLGEGTEFLIKLPQRYEIKIN